MIEHEEFMTIAQQAYGNSIYEKKREFLEALFNMANASPMGVPWHTIQEKFESFVGEREINGHLPAFTTLGMGTWQYMDDDDFPLYVQIAPPVPKSNTEPGIDLDVEENTSIENIKMLINQLVRDFVINDNDFIITMAPVSSTLITDGSSFAGFNYKELYNSEEGKYIHWFNTQCYNSFSYDTYEAIIKNGYPPEKIVMGMESGQFNESSFNEALDEIKKIESCLVIV